MTIQPIGAASRGVSTSPRRPAGARPHPRGSHRGAGPSVSPEAFSQAGISVEGTLEIEAYPELCGVLVFARFQPPRRLWFTFRSLEEVLAAARALGNPAPEGDLVWCDGVYWLSLPADAERAACLLSEFTGPADSSPFLSSRLGEHGSTLLTGEALAVLLHYFPEKME
ncbi:MAG: hypothetical protein ACLSAF_12105 [Intestinimonas sp.]